MSKRRGHNEGSIRQRSDGSWEARVSLPDGRRKSLYGKTRTEVQVKLRTAQRQLDDGIDFASGKVTLGEFLERWLRDVVQPTLAPKTHSSYSEIVRVHIVPILGRKPLARLTAADVQALIRQKEAEGKSPRTVNYIRSVLRGALNRAVKWTMISRNVAALTDPVRIVKVERAPMTPEQARTFIRKIEGDRLEALYRVALALGLRLGEALGLRWEDVDLDLGALRVRHALQRIDGELTLKEPKTAKSRRTLTLPASLTVALRAHRKRQLEERIARGADWQDLGFVFTNSLGKPLEPSNVFKQFKRHIALAGLPDQRFHDLRHAAASLLLAQGVPARVVMDILGHSQMATTMDLYSHVMPAAHADAAARMELVLSTSDNARSDESHA